MKEEDVLALIKMLHLFLTMLLEKKDLHNSLADEAGIFVVVFMIEATEKPKTVFLKLLEM